MSDATWTTLKRLLVDEYHHLRRRLSEQFGSEELASEALQDTFLRLARGGEVADHLDSPRGYLYQIAQNFARMRNRGERRRLSHVDVDELLDAVDDRPGPDQIVEARSDMRALERVLAEMPARRRQIFIAAWLENIPHRDLAVRHGLSLRMIQIELKQATEQVAERFQKAEIVDFASARLRSSS